MESNVITPLTKKVAGMSNSPESSAKPETSRQARNALIGVVIIILVITLGLVLIAIALANNASTAAPGVKVVRDLLIIVMALEMIVIGAALTVFLIQLARFVNLLSNEIHPLIASASDTVNAVRGTAIFLSKNLTEPIISIGSAIRGLSRIMGDAETIRQAVGLITTTAIAPPPARSQDSPPTETIGESKLPLDKSKLEAEHTKSKGEAKQTTTEESSLGQKE